VPEVSSRLSTLWRDLEPRRGLLFLTNIGLPILVGVIRGEVSGALIGGITGLLLSIADTEGSLGGRLCLTLMVAGGIVTGALLGLWLKAVPPTFWLCFFIGVFAAGLLNQLGKGPHFALRFGAISLGVVASLPAIVPQEYVYFAYIVLLCLLSRSVDHLINGPLGFSGPWLGNATFDRFGWFSLCACLCALGHDGTVDRNRGRQHSRHLDLSHHARAYGSRCRHDLSARVRRRGRYGVRHLRGVAV
jgi:hypothetical protein